MIHSYSSLIPHPSSLTLVRLSRAETCAGAGERLGSERWRWAGRLNSTGFWPRAPLVCDLPSESLHGIRPSGRRESLDTGEHYATVGQFLFGQTRAPSG